MARHVVLFCAALFCSCPLLILYCDHINQTTSFFTSNKQVWCVVIHVLSIRHIFTAVMSLYLSSHFNLDCCLLMLLWGKQWRAQLSPAHSHIAWNASTTKQYTCVSQVNSWWKMVIYTGACITPMVLRHVACSIFYCIIINNSHRHKTANCLRI